MYADVLFIALALGFFALCAVYVRWCDRIIGADVLDVAGSVDGDDDLTIGEVAA